jgi:hypothetical protein
MDGAFRLLLDGSFSPALPIARLGNLIHSCHKGGSPNMFCTFSSTTTGFTERGTTNKP